MLFITSQRFLNINHEGKKMYTKQNKLNKEMNRRQNTSEHQACKEFSILFNMERMDIRYKEGEEMEDKTMSFFTLCGLFFSYFHS